MKKLILLTLFLFLLYMDSYSQAKTRVNYNYLLYLPKEYSKQTKKFPLVIYLHGASHRGDDLNKLKGYGLPYLVDKGQNFEFIIASPQCPVNKYWPADNWFDSLYLDLIAKYRIDTNRIYVTGMSNGGYGTYAVAMDFPNKFAALVPLCGGCDNKDTSRICNLSDIPIWAFHGTADEKVPISQTERIAAALEKCNGKMKFTPLKDKDHWIYFVYETNPEIYKWMLKQRKGKKTKG